MNMVTIMPASGHVGLPIETIPGAAGDISAPLGTKKLLKNGKTEEKFRRNTTKPQ